MTTAIRSLLAAATAAALLAAPAARAHDRDGDGRDAPPAPAWAPPAWAPPQPPAFREPPQPTPTWRVRPGAFIPRGPWAGAVLRADYARLELARERFYAGWRGNPWRQARFERWYAVRRAELDRRAAWLTQRAGWQGPRGNAWGWRHGDRDDDD